MYCKNTTHAGSSPAQSTNLSDSYQRTEGQACRTSWTRKFRSSDNRERPINDVWCNGSTTDFGSVSGGSNPPTLTMYYLKKKKTDKPKKRQASQATLVKKLDKVFSQYIRLRDSDANGYCRCISCNRVHYWKDIQNGHYMSRRYLSTRFDEMNCNAQCVACNIFNQGNIQMYRQNLIKKIGEKNVDYLEYNAKGTTKRYSVFELQELIKYYTILVGKLESEKSIK